MKMSTEVLESVINESIEQVIAEQKETIDDETVDLTPVGEFDPDKDGFKLFFSNDSNGYPKAVKAEISKKSVEEFKKEFLGGNDLPDVYGEIIPSQMQYISKLQNSILELKRIEDLTRLKAAILIENKKSFAILSKYLDLKIYQSERKTLPFRAGI